MAAFIVAYFGLFHYVPMLGLSVAFKDFVMSEGILGSSWIGLTNFEYIFDNVYFLRALRNTLVLSLLRLIFGFFAPVVLALLLNEVRVSGYKKAVQSLTYVPHFLSWVILGGIFIMLFSQSGPVNWAIQSAGGSPVGFLTDDAWFVALLVFTGIWKTAGFGAVIYLAALAGISPSLYEAAVVDGANRWQQTVHITLPCLAPTMIVLLILNLGRILDAGFDQIYNMYNPLVYDVSDILDTYVLTRMMNYEIGIATAAGMFKSVVGMILVLMANFVSRKASGGEQGVW
jgi:putative aldouronate transport system permease protein